MTMSLNQRIAALSPDNKIARAALVCLAGLVCIYVALVVVSHLPTGLVMLSFLVGSYYVPSMVAVARHMPNAAAIFIVNTLTGWTFIGWIVALVMACSQRVERRS